MAEVASSLSAFEEPNTFEPLLPHDDESVVDVETPEEILERAMRQALAFVAKAARDTSPPDTYDWKKRSFQEGELDDSWTIVASRKTKRSRQNVIPFPAASTEGERSSGGKSGKPNRRWRRSFVALGTAAAVGLVSFFVNRRLRRNTD